MRSSLHVVTRFFLPVLALIIFLAVPSYAQQTRGDISGKVVDEQGRVVAGATVTATNKATGAARSATTDDAGEYTLTNLEPGRYDITVEAANFSKALARDFELNVGANVSQNFELKPGALTATVEVTSAGTPIE